MTENEALLAGGLLGGAVAVVLICALVFYALTVVALWKIFTKAGEAGWKSLIPIYNVYVLFKLIGINFWIWVLLVPFVIGIIGAIAFGDSQDGTNFVSGIYSLVIDVYMAIKLAKAFGKGTGFTIGLILFPNIFQIILGFDSSKYIGVEK